MLCIQKPAPRKTGEWDVGGNTNASGAPWWGSLKLESGYRCHFDVNNRELWWSVECAINAPMDI